MELGVESPRIFFETIIIFIRLFLPNWTILFLFPLLIKINHGSEELESREGRRNFSLVHLVN